MLLEIPSQADGFVYTHQAWNVSRIGAVTLAGQFLFVITPSPERRRLLAARMRRHPLRYAANARSGRVAGLRPLPLWVPPVYLLHHRLVDVQGYVSIDNNRYSVPNDLIGRRVEVRQTKEHIETYRGPRLVAVHRRVLEPTGRKYRLPEHVYKRGQAPPRVDSAPLEKTLLERLPEIAEYLQALKKHYPGHYLTPRLRRLLEMLNDYARPVLLEALETARHYGLFDLERVEKLILRKLAREHFQINPRGDDDERGDSPTLEEPPTAQDSGDCGGGTRSRPEGLAFLQRAAGPGCFARSGSINRRGGCEHASKRPACRRLGLWSPSPSSSNPAFPAAKSSSWPNWSSSPRPSIWCSSAKRAWAKQD